MTKTFALVAFAALAAGCAAGPRYVRPETVPPPEAFKETQGAAGPGASWRPARPEDETAGGRWWQAYGDPALDGLIARIDVSSPTLAKAEAQYRQALALTRSAKAGLFPTLGASASVTAQRTQAGRAGVSARYTDHLLTGSLSYEVDAWGKVRRTLESARAGAEASADDLAAVRLSLEAALAESYLALRGLDAERRLFDATLAADEKALQLTTNRYEQGVAAKYDVAQARTQLESNRAAAVDLGVQRAAYEHAIAVLVGESPSTFSIPFSPLEGVPPAIPLTIPSRLLERRPDVAAAERRAAEANAQIGVAKAAYFPDFTLAAAGGFESTSAGSWLTWPLRFWALGPALAETIFDGGRRRALTEQARAAYDGAVADYRQSALTAFQDVEDALAALRILAEEADREDAASAASAESLALALNRYTAGVASYLDVVTAQTADLAIRRAAVGVTTRRMVASIQLVKSLGGGWKGDIPDFATAGANPRPGSENRRQTDAQMRK